MAEANPGSCERCGVYALLRQGYPYCATCLVILAEGTHYLFTVGDSPRPSHSHQASAGSTTER